MTTSTLKASLKLLYADHPDILSLLDQVEYDKVDVQWRQELFSRLSEQDFNEVEAFLNSDLYTRYLTAVNQASMSMTRPLIELMNFVTTTNQGELN